MAVLVVPAGPTALEVPHGQSDAAHGAVTGVGEPYGHLCDHFLKCRNRPRIMRLRHGFSYTIPAMNRHVAARAIALIMFLLAAIVAFKVLVLNAE